MRTDIRRYLGEQFLFYDGGTGTWLQAHGLIPGELPESWNLTHTDELIAMHREFLEAGSHILLANTFGANPGKIRGTAYDLDALITAGIQNARTAIHCFRASHPSKDRPLFVSLDIGPTGHLMEPYGDLSFDEACSWFGQIVRIGAAAGADLITIETMSDSLEVKAAVLAAKENSSLPLFVTVTVDEGGRLLTGGEIEGTAALLEGLGADAIGLNCGLGPRQMEGLAERLLACTALPVIVNPNAGLPRTESGRTVYDIDAEEFGEIMHRIAEKGACVLGGCCGTTADYIARTVSSLKGEKPVRPAVRERTLVTSYAVCREIGDDPLIIGERINPTGRPWMKKALREKDTDRILTEVLAEQEEGADILDINVGLPEIDEAAALRELIPAIQAVTDLPLQIDTSSPTAMEAALRCYNGRPLVNSVSGKKESMEAIFPLVKKYGGVVIGLCLDEEGIPADSEGRLRIARRILDTASSYGIARKDIVIDGLALAVSADADSAAVTLETVRRLREELHVPTVLGVSNISFGLPAREVIGSAFFTMALQNGLSCGIVNPASRAMMDAYDASRVLCGHDVNCRDYIAHNTGRQDPEPSGKPAPRTPSAADHPKTESLSYAIEKGLIGEAATLTRDLLSHLSPLEIIDHQLIPALDRVGRRFEEGTLFLPQLLMSADAAGAAFSLIRTHLEQTGTSQEKKGKIVIATVKGDIHDIGKNIVKSLLQNYSYDVLDLGKDVEPQAIVDAARDSGAPLVGLSALMTTTVAYMEETICLLHEQLPQVKIMVGGAVLNPEYAARIGADFYGADAMASVRYAEELYAQGFFHD